MSANFDYEGAKAAGYTDQEIQDYLGKQPQYKPTNQPGFANAFSNIMNNFSNFTRNFTNPTGRQEQKPSQIEQINAKLLKYSPNFDVEGALEAGYSPQEINEHLEEIKPKRGKLEKTFRAGEQFGLGLAENALLPYELGVTPLASKEAQTAEYRKELGEDIENMLLQKKTGAWSYQDEALLQNLQKQMKDPSKSEEFIKTADLGIRSLAEELTGQYLHPEGTLEKAANWIGFIKDPSKIVKAGLNPKQLFKAIAPSGTELLRGAGAGTALQMAEDGQFGPIGTMAMAVLGDVAGGGSAALIKGGKNLITQPKKTLANVAAYFTPKDKIALQKELIKDFEQAGLQADLGTLTDNNIIKWTQSRLAQSGLAGQHLDKFKETLTNQIKEEYKSIANVLGEARYATMHEAGEVAKEGIKKIRDAHIAEVRKVYQSSEKSLKEGATVISSELFNDVKKVLNEIKPGALKSGEQKIVVDVLEKFLADMHDAGGSLKFSDVKSLINSKQGLQDVINYEVQGGTKQLLKPIVNKLERTILSYGKENPTFAKERIRANKQFSEHAKTFRNKDIESLLRESDPSKLMNRMSSIHGIRSLEKIMNRTLEGKEIFKNLKRLKLDQVIGNNLVDNTTQQVKLGTFSNLLEKGKNREIIKEILGPKEFKRLELVQKNAGKLADSADKFYNASKSGVVAADAAILAKGLSDVAALLMGSPWPIIKTVGTVITARKFGQLISDPEFLKLVEDVIKNSGKSEKQLFNSIELLRPYLIEGLHQMSND